MAHCSTCPAHPPSFSSLGCVCQCFCSAPGDDPAELGESEGCTFSCSGDSTEKCGGFNAINVYKYVNERNLVGCYVDDGGDRVLTGDDMKGDPTMNAEVNG